MTDEQREQARRAQAVYVAWLREWENFIRNREAYRQRENHVTENGDGEITSICPFTNADIEKPSPSAVTSSKRRMKPTRHSASFSSASPMC